LGTDDVGVSLIDTTSIVLARADGVGDNISPFDGPLRPGVEIEDVGTPFEGDLCDCQEAGRDGIDDLVIKFTWRDIVAALQLHEFGSGDTVELVVTGTLQDGLAFSASDCMLIVP
jgi:hypothetical protein